MVGVFVSNEKYNILRTITLLCRVVMLLFYLMHFCNLYYADLLCIVCYLQNISFCEEFESQFVHSLINNN